MFNPKPKSGDLGLGEDPDDFQLAAETNEADLQKQEKLERERLEKILREKQPELALT